MSKRDPVINSHPGMQKRICCDVCIDFNEYSELTFNLTIFNFLRVTLPISPEQAEQVRTIPKKFRSPTTDAAFNQDTFWKKLF